MTKKLIYFQLFFVLFIYLIAEWTPIPTASRYLADVVLILIAVLSAKQWTKIIKWPQIKFFLIALSFFAGYVLINGLYNHVSVWLILYAYRNTFRFYVFLMMVIVNLDPIDVKRLFNILFILQIVNVPMSIYQYLFVTKNWDMIGGIFGTWGGVNGYSNLFFIILVIYFTLAYLDKKVHVAQTLFVILSTLALSALAEIKYFFIEIFVITISIILLNLKSKKVVVVSAMVIVGLGSGLFLLQRIFPLAFGVFTSFEQLYGYMTMTGGGYYIGRAGAFSRINEMFFNHEPLKILFGLGFGNCEESSFSFMTSDFAREYGHLNYRFFSHALAYLETGLVGIALYLATYFALVFDVFRHYKRVAKDKFPLNMIVSLFVSVVMIFFYNHSLKYEASYLMHFALAVPFIILKDQSNLNTVHR